MNLLEPITLESIEYILEPLCSCSRNRPNWYLNEILRSGALISIRPIERDPRGQQRMVTVIQVLEESGQGKELARNSLGLIEKDQIAWLVQASSSSFLF
jgi:hypothetical protein